MVGIQSLRGVVLVYIHVVFALSEGFTTPNLHGVFHTAGFLLYKSIISRGSKFPTRPLRSLKFLGIGKTALSEDTS